DTRIFVANYHALTAPIDSQTPEELRESTIDVAIDYLAIGLDPQKVNIFLQTSVPEVSELMWIFDCITTVPYLQRAHSYKDAVAKKEEINVGTFNYPLLMAADILIQDADVVPVGADQKQHLEIARDTAEKFNRLFGETFKLPEPIIMEDVKTVPGLDGRKMSKSYGNTIPLFAEDEEIKKAVMSIVTDSKAPEEPKDPQEDNIFALHKLFSTNELPDIEKRYKEGGMGYKQSKEILIKNVVSFIAPLREKRKEIAKDKDAVLKILENSGNIAHSTAKAKMMEVRERVGLSI
ncbi:Tryptophanyl-tRNA synthetase, partial [hydrothermal vent metagenome]